ncbi:MAG TPA: class I adenylate-forming enzyme family protein [Polyangiaceae bacterium]|nr:class I adenylate-forming enzyme family protein [Polyangiaceae bacterium]
MTEPFDVFAAAREVPDRIALVEPGRSWSYAELALLSGQALAWLRARGVSRAGDATPAAVAVLAHPTPHQIAMTFALMAAGVPCLPVHPRLTEPERTALVVHAQASLYVDTAWQHEPAASTSQPAFPSRSGASEAPLALVQTSGTTAGPRLALLSERAFRSSAAAHAAHLGWTRTDRWLLALPFAHIGGLSILTRCLAARSTVALPVFASGAGAGGSAAQVAGSLEPLGVSLLSMVPTQLEQLLELSGWRTPSSLRAVLVGGAAANEATLTRARARGLPVLPTYGMTETCSQICTRAVAPESAEAGVGRPLSGVELAIVDGEIHVRGATLFSGYWGDPEQYTPSTWFPTGDLGSVDDHGCLHVLGRLADRIISGGENVNPLEVERVLGPCVAPRRLCIFGREDSLWGEQVALAIEGPADPALIERVTQTAQDRLAGFKRPRLVAFVERLPELAPGKVQRRALVESRSLPLIRMAYTRG